VMMAGVGTADWQNLDVPGESVVPQEEGTLGYHRKTSGVYQEVVRCSVPRLAVVQRRSEVHSLDS
jgi:hypothetical protein